MATKTKAKGVIIKYGDSAAPTTTIPSLAEVSFDNGQWDRVETTTHDTSGSTKTFATTLKEPASLDVRIILDPTDTAHDWLIDSSDSGAAVYMTLVLPDSGTATWALVGNITSLKTNAMATGNLIEVSFTFNGTASHTYTQ